MPSTSPPSRARARGGGRRSATRRTINIKYFPYYIVYLFIYLFIADWAIYNYIIIIWKTVAMILVRTTHLYCNIFFLPTLVYIYHHICRLSLSFRIILAVLDCCFCLTGVTTYCNHCPPPPSSSINSGASLSSTSQPLTTTAASALRPCVRRITEKKAAGACCLAPGCIILSALLGRALAARAAATIIGRRTAGARVIISAEEEDDRLQVVVCWLLFQRGWCVGKMLLGWLAVNGCFVRGRSSSLLPRSTVLFSCHCCLVLSCCGTTRS